MLDEQMDDMIREAAEKHHPAYHDDAWEKMQQKLDAEMPQKPARKRYIYYLLLLLLMGGAVYTGARYFNGKGKNEETVIAKKENTNAVKPSIQNGETTVQPADANPPAGNDNGNAIAPATNNAPVATAATPRTDVNTAGNVQAAIPGANTMQPANASFKNKNGHKPATAVVTAKGKRSRANDVVTNDQAIDPTINNRYKRNKPVTGNDDAGNDVLANAAGRKKITTKGKTNMRISSPGIEGENIPATNTAGEPGNENTVAVNPSQKTNEQKDKKAPSDSLKKEDIAKEKKQHTDSAKLVTAPKEKEKKKGFAGNFGITVSAGTDASFIKLDKAGKATFIYGAGLSYNISKRFTVQAGFYVSKKIYSASADEYNPPGGNYPYFTGADAVCKVYEIPVSVNYNFAQRKNHNWFAGAGVSTFLMKQEDYDYNYKNPAGQTYSYKRSVSNENKHYFSVLNLTAGYQYNFNSRISLMAAPFVKIPLGGVGLGDIRLKSGGVMFTAVVRPFAKKK